MARKRQRMGFTMVEVMMGLAVLAVGAATVIALLKFTVLGALDSRHVANSTIVTSACIERLQTASLTWNNVDNLNADMLNMDVGPVPGLGSAAIAARATPGVANANGWVYFGGSVTNARSTLSGDQANAAGTDAAYCTHMRIVWTSRPLPNTPSVGPAGDNFRVELRTFWARSGRTIGADCAETPDKFTGIFNSPTATDTIAGLTRSRAEYGVVYMNTLVRRNTQ
jgi:prepilin-type N-terminal cleavage/methylation domain-containing protein